MAEQRRAHMVVESAGAEKERRSWEPTRSLIVTESPLSLPQWLEVSWFYPEGFVKERIVETERSFVVLGNGIAYKFLKTSPERHFSARWQAACEEVLDNISLAPELYLGLRVLRWIDDEPHWFSEYRSADLDPLRPPADADDVAIIMRRIPDGEMLHQALAAHRRRTDQTLRAAARTLRRFHEGQQRVPRPEAFPLSQNSLRRIYLAPLQRFIAEDAHSLDTFTHYALREVAFWINAFLEREEPRLRAK